MARKSNQQKNGLDHHTLNHKRRGSVSGCNPTNMKGHGKACEVKVFPGEVPNGNQPSKFAESVSKANYASDENKSEKKSENLSGTEKQGMGAMRGPEQPMSSETDSGDCIGNMEASTEQENGMLHGPNQGREHKKSILAFLPNGLNIKNVIENVEFPDNFVVRSVRASALSVLKAASEWLDRQRPLFATLTTKILNARDYARMKVEQAYPIVLKWLMHFGSIMLLISMVWLDCTLRGIDSFLRMGTTSFFSVIWFGIFSVIAMVGMLKFLIVLVSPVYVCDNSKILVLHLLIVVLIGLSSELTL
jgi:DnaJ family protein C protein 14